MNLSIVAFLHADNTFKEIARVIAQNGRLAIVEFKKEDSPHGPLFP
jgi:ubiquinone/menaquinone biosynthesis C-methylase UbiE